MDGRPQRPSFLARLTRLTSQFFRYLFTSGLAAGVNFGSRFVYGIWLSFTPSVVVAYLTGMLVNFVLSKRFVFDARESKATRVEFLKFGTVASIGLLFTLVASWGALAAMTTYAPHLAMELQQGIAHAAGIAVGFVANFAGHRFFTFKATARSWHPSGAPITNQEVSKE